MLCWLSQDFWYYSYSRNPTGRGFFDPAGTLIAVNLLDSVPLTKLEYLLSWSILSGIFVQAEHAHYCTRGACPKTAINIGGAWAGGTEYGGFLNKFILFYVLCHIVLICHYSVELEFSQTYILSYYVDISVFLCFVSHYLYLRVLCFVSHSSHLSFLHGVEVCHTRTQNATIFTLLLLSKSLHNNS